MLYDGYYSAGNEALGLIKMAKEKSRHPLVEKLKRLLPSRRGRAEEDKHFPSIRLFKIEEVPNCLVINFTGFFSADKAAIFQQRVITAIKTGFTRLIFLFPYGYMGTTDDKDRIAFLGTLVAFTNAARARDGDSVFLEVDPQMREIIELLGFGEFFNFKDSLQEALYFFVDKLN